MAAAAQALASRSLSVLRLLSLAAVPAVAAGGAAAECQVQFTSAELHLGSVIPGALADSEWPGWRQFGGARTALLTVSCDAPRASLRLRLGQLAPAGDRLLRWDAVQPASAMRLRAGRATADGVPVALVVDDQPAAVAVDLARDGAVLALQLAPLGRPARQFAVEIEARGLLGRDFAPTAATTLTLKPQVELLEP